MIAIKNLASFGDLRTWSGYATDDDGHGATVRAIVGDRDVVITIGTREYECDRPATISVGDIRSIMQAAYAQHQADTRRYAFPRISPGRQISAH